MIDKTDFGKYYCIRILQSKIYNGMSPINLRMLHTDIGLIILGIYIYKKPKNISFKASFLLGEKFGERFRIIN